MSAGALIVVCIGDPGPTGDCPPVPSGDKSPVGNLDTPIHPTLEVWKTRSNPRGSLSWGPSPGENLGPEVTSSQHFRCRDVTSGVVKQHEVTSGVVKQHEVIFWCRKTTRRGHFRCRKTTRSLPVS